MTSKFQVGQNGQSWLVYDVFTPQGVENKLIFALRPTVSEIWDIFTFYMQSIWEYVKIRKNSDFQNFEKKSDNFCKGSPKENT